MCVARSLSILALKVVPALGELRDHVGRSAIGSPSPETIFDGMELQRLRLHHDQQVPEWE
jgi:hypothetical protein